MFRAKSCPFILLLVFILPINLFCQDPSAHKPAFRNTRTVDARVDVNYWSARLDGMDLLNSISGRELMFHAESGNSIAVPEGYVSTEFSRDGSNLVITSVLPTNKSKVGDKILRLQVYAASGRLRFELQRNYVFDEPLPVMSVLDGDRGIVLGNSFTGIVNFYGRTGELIRAAELFAGSYPDLERILVIAASGETDLVAVAASRRSSSPLDSGAPDPSGEPTVFAFSVDGREEWRKNLPGTTPGHIAVSPDGQFLLASSYASDSKGNIDKHTALLDRRGQELKEYDFLFRMAEFSHDSRFLIMANRSVARCIQLPGGEELWHQEVSRKQGMITAVKIGEDPATTFILVAKDEFKDRDFIFTNPQLLIFDRAGSQIQRIDFAGREFKRPALFLKSDGRKFGVGFRDRFMYFEPIN